MPEKAEDANRNAALLEVANSCSVVSLASAVHAQSVLQRHEEFSVVTWRWTGCPFRAGRVVQPVLKQSVRQRGSEKRPCQRADSLPIAWSSLLHVYNSFRCPTIGQKGNGQLPD